MYTICVSTDMYHVLLWKC